VRGDTKGGFEGGFGADFAEESFRAVLNDFSEASEQRLSKSMKLKKTCAEGLDGLWLSEEIEFCPKLGNIF